MLPVPQHVKQLIWELFSVTLLTRIEFSESHTNQNYEYRVFLNAAVDTSRLLLRQELPFDDVEGSEQSYNEGNLWELLKCIVEKNSTVGNVMSKVATGDNQMVPPNIEKDIVHCFAQESVHSIVEEIGDDVFGLLFDECTDISDNEHMAVILRYVEKCGLVKERFLGVVHVEDVSDSSLKSCIDSLFAEYGLSLKQVRGQSYNGASYMRVEFNGLRDLIKRENSSAYYVHCFAHLQLIVVEVSKKHRAVVHFFDMIVGASCKQEDSIQQSQQVSSTSFNQWRDWYWRRVKSFLFRGFEALVRVRITKPSRA